MATPKGLSKRQISIREKKYNVDFRTAEQIARYGFEFYFDRFISEILPYLKKVAVVKDSATLDASIEDYEELKLLLDRISTQTQQAFNPARYELEYDRVFKNIENKKKAAFEQEIFAKIGIKPNARIMSGIDQSLKTRIEMQVAGIALEFERVSRLENRTLSDNLVSKQLEEINAVTNRVLQGVKAGERWESISMAILGRKDPKTSSQVVKAAAREGNQQAAKMLNRARFIARNAVSTAQGEYDKQIQLKTGIRLYRWSTSDDERVRPTHEKLDGKIFAWEPGTTAPKDITIDGKTYAEGDIIPTASDPNYNGGAPTIPGQPYNCRCVALAVIEGIDY